MLNNAEVKKLLSSHNTQVPSRISKIRQMSSTKSKLTLKKKLPSSRKLLMPMAPKSTLKMILSRAELMTTSIMVFSITIHMMTVKSLISSSSTIDL